MFKGLTNAVLCKSIFRQAGTFIYVLEGAAHFGARRTYVEKHSATIFSDGDFITISASELGVRLVLLAGKPLGEPIAWGGPTVMNTDEEIHAAFSELRQGTFIKQQ